MGKGAAVWKWLPDRSAKAGKNGMEYTKRLGGVWVMEQ